MANQEDSACEIPLKRPRLDAVEDGDQANQELIIKDTENNKDPSIPSNIEKQATGAVSAPNTSGTEVKNESVMSNDGSSSGEVNRVAALDNSDSDNLSEISDLSGMSEDAWKPIAGPISWVQQQMTLGHNPREILQDLVTADTVIPADLDDFTMWKIIINLMSEPPKRKKLHHINTLDDVLELLKTCKKIMVLTGAGVSVSCGIPDFRSRNGIYARLAVDFPDLPDPQAMFDIRYFRNDPRPFFKFAKEIYPGQFEPSRCHKFIRLIEEHGKLLRNYTQNIDTLEQVAGITNVIQCHGSFAGATCMVCRHKVTAEDVKEDIFNQIIPLCPVCPADSPMSILKPDIVFFGESLPDEFHRQMAEDKDECDLLIVIGSSLKVRPVALIPNSLPSHVPQILINREPLPHMNFDVELLGDCDCIINELCKRLGEGWVKLGDTSPPLNEIRRNALATPLSLSTSVSHTDATDHKTVDSNKVSIRNMDDRMAYPQNDSAGSANNREMDLQKELKQSTDDKTVDSQKDMTESKCSDHKADETITSVTVNTENGESTVSGKDVSEEHGIVSQSESPVNIKQGPVALISHLEEEVKALNGNRIEDLSSRSDSVNPISARSDDITTEVSKSDKTIEPSCGVQTTGIISSLKPDSATEIAEEEKELYGALDTSLQEMRRMWHSQERQSVAKRLKDDQYLFLPPCRYVFHGAEVTSIEDESEDSDQDSSVSESRDLHSSQCGDEAGEVTNNITHPHPDTGGGESAADIKLFSESGITEPVQEAYTLT